MYREKWHKWVLDRVEAHHCDSCWGMFGTCKYLLSPAPVLAQPHILPAHYQNHYSPFISLLPILCLTQIVWQQGLRMLPSILAMLLNHPVNQPVPMQRWPRTWKLMLQRQRLPKMSQKSWALHNAPSLSRKLWKGRICMMLLLAQTSPCHQPHPGTFLWAQCCWICSGKWGGDWQSQSGQGNISAQCSQQQRLAQVTICCSHFEDFLCWGSQP